MIIPNYEVDWRFPYFAADIYALDQAGIWGEFPWIRAMKDVPQNPHYHGEGDVYTHTLMVVEEMIQMAEWKQLSPVAQNMLFAAALLHDVAKPVCTQIEADGQITSRGHAKKGSIMARNLLWDSQSIGWTTPFAIRETIVALVRYHGLPLWLWERENPEREIYMASQQVRLDWVAFLAEADVRGRICSDQQELLTRVALFRDFCQELGCYQSAKSFANDHSRFLYFQKRETASDPYPAFDHTTFEVILMSGLPGAGKDTWIAENRPNSRVISLDQIRKDRGISPTAPQGEVIQIAKHSARLFLRKKKSFIWNATNLSIAIRKPLIDLFSRYGARVRIVYVEAPIEEIIKRNRARKRGVPEPVLRKMQTKLEIPTLIEAHQVDFVHSS